MNFASPGSNRRFERVALPMLATACAIALSACTAGIATASATPPKAPVRATLDPSSETITLPIDKYDMTMVEWHRVQYATELLVSRCLGKAGYVYPAIDDTDTTPGTVNSPAHNWIWGIWGESQASTYGYRLPPASVSGQALLSANSAPMEAGEEAALTTCEAQAKRSGLDTTFVEQGLVYQEEQSSYAVAEKSVAARGAQKKWAACVRASGLTVSKENPFIPDGVLTTDAKAQIEAAITDVACKKSSALIPTLAELAATSQARYISTHRSALQQFHAQVDRVVATANQVIANTP